MYNMVTTCIEVICMNQLCRRSMTKYSPYIYLVYITHSALPIKDRLADDGSSFVQLTQTKSY